MKTALAALAVPALLAFGLFAQSVQTPRKAPDLTYTVPGHGTEHLSQYRGKVILLEFILTTCPHCQASAKEMALLQQKYGAQGFQAIDLAINGLDENRTPNQADGLVQNFASTYGATNFPVGWINRDEMPAFMGFSLVERTVVPQLAFIDRKGNIRFQTDASSESDLRKPEVMEQKVVQLLSERDTASRQTPSRHTGPKRPS